MSISRPTYARIDLDNLRFNFRSSRNFIGPAIKYMAVVKANAYGHGAIECSRVLVEEGVDWLGVSLFEEALELRRAGISAPILCLGGLFAGQENESLKENVTPVIFNLDQASALNQAAKRADRMAKVHVKVDTGMGRLGIRWDSLEPFLRGFSKMLNLRLEGLMTHFAVADDLSQSDFTNLQIERFHRSVETFEASGQRADLVDLANSPGAVAHPRSRAQMVRLGGILYGLGGDVLPGGVEKPELKPVMSLRSAIADIKRVPAGETIGYGRIFTTSRDSVIALLPIGYDDGYSRSLSNNSNVIINGVFAPVVGRVSMDWTIIDVTDVSDPTIGNEVFLTGSNGSVTITAEDLARKVGTISYEITCGISARVPRRYIDAAKTANF